MNIYECHFKIFVRENWGNQEWTIQRHWQHLIQDTGRRQTKQNTTQETQTL